ncbi:hypothetical protein [Cyanobacterium aponinum]|uniref:Uncharacterized protein n=1 Tax=Cyanobacterium aponinum (strain PCC 10605) TaxID=755178 RepID=K9ZB24_CYAAP|nr:hypothetical protein [Cyanobacterium aponinum]AFZ55578.1 hypothetical protein Cyan10605_3545 [Cyanobacterium aponinum PCC 10605]
MINLNIYKSHNNTWYLDARGCNNVDWILLHPDLKPYVTLDEDGGFITLEGMETLGKIALCDKFNHHIYIPRRLAEIII